MKANLNPGTFFNDYKELFVPGRLCDIDLERRILRLSGMFDAYSRGCPEPIWAPGLRVTEEIERITETYLCSNEILRAFLRLVKCSLLVECPPPPALSENCGWLKLIERLPNCLQTPNPASLLLRLAENESDRQIFLFSVYLPDHYGGAFGRYPLQLGFIRGWFENEVAATGLKQQISCLDAASGSGEGSLELAGTIRDCVVESMSVKVTGITVNPLEVFAAAHGYFPHDPGREKEYRKYLKWLDNAKTVPEIDFITGDLKSFSGAGQYNLIVCNGILGGPFLNHPDEIDNVVLRLVRSLKINGLLLATDRFHGGWKKKITRAQMENLFLKSGLEIVQAGEGVAGVLRQVQI